LFCSGNFIGNYLASDNMIASDKLSFYEKRE